VDLWIVHPIPLPVYDVVADLHVLDDLGQSQDRRAGPPRWAPGADSQNQPACDVQGALNRDGAADVAGIAFAARVFDLGADRVQLDRQAVNVGVAQVVKDYVAVPALTSLSPGATVKSTATANLMANVVRNAWTYAVVFCGHFPNGAEKFTERELDDETKGQWYLRQILGSANIKAGPLLAFLTGNLSYQIEHHLYPDLPSNRLAEIAVRVQQVCSKYDLPYSNGSFVVQYAQSWRTIAKLSLPDTYLAATADDAPETRSEKMFARLSPQFADSDPATGGRRGLNTAITAVRSGR
jgi:NADPH-dependent stearoyl-CoA 9-desaturase